MGDLIMSKNRNRRLRKKLRVGEFQELGFEVEIQVSDNVDMDVLVDEFLIEVLDNNGMMFGGGYDKDEGWLRGFVTKRGRGTLTEEHRTIVKDWFASRQEVKEFEAKSLVDAWHGWDD